MCLHRAFCLLAPKQISFLIMFKWKKKKLVSGNAGDKKNLHRGCRKFIFSIDFAEIFTSLFSFAFFVFLFSFLLVCMFLLLFFLIENIYSDTHSTMRAGD